MEERVSNSRHRDASLELDRLQWGRLEDWLQLVRLPTVFTLLSNCLAAVAVAGGNWLPVSGLIPTLLASLAAYWAGMILNDVVDVEEDRRDRPNRPLAAGRVSVAIASQVSTALLLICPLIILGTTALHTSEPLWQGAAFAAAVGLSLCVRAYDSSLKKTPLGPLLMGSCRALNILMVGLTMLAITPMNLKVESSNPSEKPSPTQFEEQRSPADANASRELKLTHVAFLQTEPNLLLPPSMNPEDSAQPEVDRVFVAPANPNTQQSRVEPQAQVPSPGSQVVEALFGQQKEPTTPPRPFPMTLLYFAAAIGVYIVGVTVFARSEEERSSNSAQLSFGLILQIAGLIIIALLPRWFRRTETPWVLHPSQGYPLLIGLIGMTVGNRAVQAISHPVSRKVQLAVKHALLTLILIDAAVVLMWLGPWYGCAVVALLLPAMYSAIAVRMT